jgi:hypothetical protein
MNAALTYEGRFTNEQVYYSDKSGPKVLGHEGFISMRDIPYIVKELKVQCMVIVILINIETIE